MSFSPQITSVGTLTDGTVFDGSVDEEHKVKRDPLEFEAGAGQMIKGFDAAVIGMKEGEEKTVTLAPEEAYGERNEELVTTFSKAELEGF